ncbi:MAG: aminoglycoside phosphotransferase [Frankiales bacterium]|nr:aminoglycoside phosphotransferase [Frankiales bacterium]
MGQIPEPSAADGPPAAVVAGWLRARGVQVDGTVSIELIPGGRSNLTYLVADAGGHRWVLRRPPLAGVIASAHDVLREHRIMAAVAGTGVPVPAMVGACADESLIGAPFFVMEHVEGVVPRNREVAEAALSLPARAAVGDSLADALARLHAVPAAEVRLGDLGGRHQGRRYVSRQLDRWKLQLERLGAAAGPELHAVFVRLQDSVPEQREVTLVHGDYRAGNTIVGPDGRVRAVLDWELATVGDPLADLGWLVAYWGSPRLPELPMSVPSTAPGFAPVDAVVARYAGLAGRDVTDLDFYVAFALWRLAAIVSGVNARVRQHAYGSAEPSSDDEPTAEGDRRVAVLTAAAEAATTGAGR